MTPLILVRQKKNRLSSSACCRMMIPFLLLWIGCLVAKVTSSSDHELMCSIGFGNPTKHVIPVEKINDGYCDCPSDGGIDELETGACSGSDIGGWSGNQRYSSDDDVPLMTFFQCTEENQLWLAPSKVKDGICDCCDGADELPGVCDDICDEVLAGERAEREALQSAFMQGSKLRQKDASEFMSKKESTLAQLEQIQNTQMPPLQQELDQYQIQIKETQLHFISQKLEAMKQIYETTIISDNRDIYPPFDPNTSLQQVQTFLVSLCHYYGEMTHHNNNHPKKQNTCVPLRMAALDLGIWWEAENLDQKTAMVQHLSTETYTHELALELADHYYKLYTSSNNNINKNNTDDSSDDDENDTFSEMAFPQAHNLPTKNHRNHKRYREEIDNDKFDNDYIIEENIIHEDEEIFDSQNKERDSFSSPIMIWRNNFYEFSKAKLEKFEDEPFDSREDPTEEGEAFEVDTNDDSHGSDGEHVDPMAIQMLRTNLEHRVGSIERGNAIAETGYILLDSLKESKDITIDTWLLLVVGSIWHSNISVADVAEILTLSNIQENTESCVSPYILLCSNDDTNHKEKNNSFLSSPTVLQHISSRCDQRKNNQNRCATIDDSYENSEKSNPSSIPDGYLDYYTVMPRTDTDPYTQIFENIMPMIEETDSILQTLFDLNRSYEEVNQKLSDLKKEVEELELSVGVGEDGKDFGPDGELYALKDTCLEISAGKYIYKLCLFGQAAQIDGSSNTNLGQWKGIERNDDDASERIWIWGGGSKCWNGPHRSATAFVRCGIETKIISAEEPNICQYEFEIESHIACDDAFKDKYGL